MKTKLSLRAAPAVFAMVFAALALSAPAIPALAASHAGSDKDAAYRGVWLSTPYPDQNVPSGKTVTLDVTVHNSGLPPERVDLSTPRVSDGWTADFIASGRPVGAVFVGPDSTSDVKLRLTPPKGEKKGTYRFTLAAKGTEGSFSLPVKLTLGNVLPPRIALDPEFPALTGTPSSDFSFKVTLKNDSGRDALVRLDAKAPSNFQVSFQQEYSSQELTSLPVKAGQSQSIKVSVNMPQHTPAGAYPVLVRARTPDASAQTRLTLDVTGRPELTLTAPDGRLSADAEAGKETPINVVLRNDGSAPARDIKLSASPPHGWKVSFDPKSVDALPPDGEQKVQAMITPSAKAIAGDYMVTLSANGKGINDSNDFRITVRTSTLWGVVGVAVIAASLVVLALAVVRYGRR